MFKPIVVLVDDEPHTLNSIARLLRETPLAPHTFVDVADSLAFLAATPAAVVVSDFRMPAMNGIELLERAAALQPDSSRLLLTGYADLQTAIDAINRGAVSRFLSKPWEEKDLVGALLDGAAASTLNRLLAALPSFQNAVLDLRGSQEVTEALQGFLRQAGGLGIEAEEGEPPPGAQGALIVSAGGRTLTLRLDDAHRAVFRDPLLRERLQDLVSIVARTALLVASQRLMETELLRLSEVDGLSGVLNRRALDRELAREVDRASRYNTPLCLAIIDIDRFKIVNDTAGHQAGDAIITGLGKVLHEITRSTDIAARYGGDEFCLLVPGLDAGRAAAAALRIREAAARIPVPGQPGAHVTLSIGIAAWAQGMDASMLVSRADHGVYVVKESGRDGIAIDGVQRVIRDAE
jgi:diguanylate cyclase (GGDEF)-like protein